MGGKVSLLKYWSMDPKTHCFFFVPYAAYSAEIYWPLLQQCHLEQDWGTRKAEWRQLWLWAGNTLAKPLHFSDSQPLHCHTGKWLCVHASWITCQVFSQYMHAYHVGLVAMVMPSWHRTLFASIALSLASNDIHILEMRKNYLLVYFMAMSWMWLHKSTPRFSSEY